MPDSPIPYYSPDPHPRKHSEWGLAAFIFAIVVLVWIMLPAVGLRRERVDVFHNLSCAGPLMSTVGIAFAAVGICQKDRNTSFAKVALALNLMNALLSLALYSAL